MRTAFIEQLITEARTNPKIFLLVGDLGYHVVEPFAAEFPDRFLNVGIAEQNMAGVAAGLSMCGFNVYMYSIGNFPTLRCIEQIRNDIAYHSANVKIVAVGGGYAYGALGATHHATEALGMMRVIPNMVVCSPSDPIESKVITHVSSSHEGPMYIQLGKAGEKCVRNSSTTFSIGDVVPLFLRHCHKAIIVTGSIAAKIVDDGSIIDFDIYTLPFIKPINKDQLKAILNKYDSICIVEEHQKSGGVGSAIVEIANDLYYDCVIDRYPKIRRVAIDDVFSEVSGSQDYLRALNHLTL